MAKVNIRNRNEGQFYKDGRRKPPNWEYRFESAKVDGKRQTISKAGFATKKEAEQAGAKAMAEYDRAGMSFEPSEISVSDYMQYWLDNYCKFNVADSTLSKYSTIIRIHVNPRIGAYRLKSISTMQLQEMINAIYVDKNLTKSYMGNILKCIKGAFKYAYLTARLISSNPAEYVTLPKSNAPQQEEIIILSKENVKAILERFKPSKYQYYAMKLAYYSGLRVSEVYGLTWDCVDFENSTITVNKICKKIEKEGKVSDGKRKRGTRGKASTRWYFGDCKTPSSYRTVQISSEMMDDLKEFKEWQEANEMQYGELYLKQYAKPETTETHRQVTRLIPMQDTGFEIPLERIYPVFIKENGEYHGSDSMKYCSKVVNYEMGIKFNFHAFRHTHATMLVESGVPLKAIAERLGHGSVRTTIETYVHVTDTMRSDAVEMFDKIGSLESNIVSIREKQIIEKKVAK